MDRAPSAAVMESVYRAFEESPAQLVRMVRHQHKRRGSRGQPASESSDTSTGTDMVLIRRSVSVDIRCGYIAGTRSRTRLQRAIDGFCDESLGS